MKTIDLKANISFINLLIYKKTLFTISPGSMVAFNLTHTESAEDLVKLINRSADHLVNFLDCGDSFQLTVQKACEQKNNKKGG